MPADSAEQTLSIGEFRLNLHISILSTTQQQAIEATEFLRASFRISLQSAVFLRPAT